MFYEFQLLHSVGGLAARKLITSLKAEIEMPKIKYAMTISNQKCCSAFNDFTRNVMRRKSFINLAAKAKTGTHDYIVLVRKS